mgnify:CR=1 FL=1
MNRYDTAMGRAYIRYLNGVPPPEINAPVLVEHTPSLSEIHAGRRAARFRCRSERPVRRCVSCRRRSSAPGSSIYVDGHFGATTQQALMEYQRRFGIAAGCDRRRRHAHADHRRPSRCLGPLVVETQRRHTAGDQAGQAKAWFDRLQPEDAPVVGS